MTRHAAKHGDKPQNIYNIEEGGGFVRSKAAIAAMREEGGEWQTMEQIIKTNPRQYATLEWRRFAAEQDQNKLMFKCNMGEKGCAHPSMTKANPTHAVNTMMMKMMID